MRSTRHNSTLAIGGVSSPLDSFVVAESSVLRTNFCAEKPAHRQSAKTLYVTGVEFYSPFAGSAGFHSLEIRLCEEFAWEWTFNARRVDCKSIFLFKSNDGLSFGK